MISKDLVKKMSFAEAQRYCDEHPEYRIPDGYEATNLDSEHGSFWISETLGDRNVLYVPMKQVFRMTHPSFLHFVVVVKDDNEK